MSNSKEQHYSGVFNIDNQEYVGEIVLDYERGKIFLLLTILTDGIGKQFTKIDIIKGKIGGGKANVTLIVCKPYSGHTYLCSHQNICFKVENMFWSDNELDDLVFDSYDVVFENALRWSGLTCIDRAENQEIKFNDHKKFEFKFKDYQILFISKVIKNLNVFPTQEENAIVERLSMHISTSEKRNYTEFLKIRDLFSSIICFCIKNNINFLNQTFNKSDVNYSLSNGIIIPYDFRFFDNIEKKIVFDSNHEFDMNFTLSMLDADFFNCDENIEKIDKLKPIFNLYLSLFKYQDMPEEMIFLNLIQAIETFHSRFKYEKKEEYKSHVFSLVNNSNFENLLKPRLWDGSQSDDNCPFITLHSRLNDLLINTERDLFRSFYFKEDYAQKICNTRNYLTHYDPKKESIALKGDDLYRAIYVLELVLEYYICAEFKIDRSEYIFLQVSNMLALSERNFK